MKRAILALRLLLAVGFSEPVFASEPPGMENKDWARERFTISSDAKVRVAGSNRTIPVRTENYIR
jgi:hypothetical protein